MYEPRNLYIPGRGRFWLCSDDGVVAYWYDQPRHVKSGDFDAYDAATAADEFDWLFANDGFAIDDPR